MNSKTFILSILACTFLALPAYAADSSDELDPFAPDVEQTLKAFDAVYEKTTGQSAHLDDIVDLATGADNLFVQSCYRQTCPLWIHVDKSSQTLTMYINGNQAGRWLVSSGIPGRDTPDFDTHPDGRIYHAYTSKKYPEGDYHGLGNMPYAIFIQGGFALHGTPFMGKLGRKASHGCIRMHPDNAARLNGLVRSYGVRSTWITVD
jgi:hypothetical protein